jgi:hypothetical protein
MGFFKSSKVKTVKVAFLIPKEVVLRSNMLCSYLTKEAGYNFTLNEFVTFIYNCFIEECFQVYNPLGILNILNYNYSDIITIKDGTEVYTVDRNIKNTKLVEFTLTETDAKGGLEVLEELKELYNYKSNLGNLVLKVWINFINRFKKDGNNEMLDTIVDMLKK